MNVLHDKILGCLIGGAIGDALGYAVEFMQYNSIVKQYGPKGIVRFDLDNNGLAQISDDTQMTLYTAEGLLNCMSDSREYGTLQWPTDHIKQAYIDWYYTQTLDPAENDKATCRLSLFPEMYSLRAPGNTCLSALRALEKGKEVINNSKGCGGIMRVAPVALVAAAHPDIFHDVALIASEAARLTHHHPLGYLPAGLFAYVIHDVITSTDPIDRSRLKKSVNNGLHEIARIVDCGQVEGGTEKDVEILRTNTRRAIDLADTDMPDVEAIRQLGEGWVGDEAWYIVIYCALRHIDSFEDAIIAAVNHSGDSDSTGAICGNLMGAIHGYNAIPSHFKINLEHHDLIEEMANAIITGKHKH